MNNACAGAHGVRYRPTRAFECRDSHRLFLHWSPTNAFSTATASETRGMPPWPMPRGLARSVLHWRRSSPTLNELTTPFPSKFKPFDALYAIVRTARNDAMHTGAYARHATREAIELCIGLEDALMSGVAQTVGNLMVSTAIAVEPWQPVAHARQLMLMHSFSFLPVRMDGTWHLVSELGLAKYLRNGLRNSRLAESLETAKGNGMELVSIHDTQLLQVGMKVEEVLSRAQVQQGPMLWLVVEDDRPDHLAGVLSPFELM